MLASSSDVRLVMGNFFVALKQRLASVIHRRPSGGTYTRSTDLAVQLEQAFSFYRQGRLGDAEGLYRAVLVEAPNHFDALHILGMIAFQKGQHASALELIDRAIAINPNFAMAHFNRGLFLHVLGRLKDALLSYDRAVELKPDYLEALSNRGTALLGLKRPHEALLSYDRALELKPDSVEAVYNRGNALLGLKRLGEALASYDRAVELKPDYAEAFYNRGNAFLAFNSPDDALASYDRAVELKPDYAEAFNNRGRALVDLYSPEEALASFDRALTIKPGYDEALNNRGNVLRDLKRFDEALASYDRALAIKADYPDALNNRGNVLRDLKRFESALDSYDRALTIKPDYSEAHSNRGNVLRDLRRFDEALASYDRALAIRPGYADALSNRGSVLREMKRFDEALASFDRALAIEPDSAFLFGLRVFSKMNICDWRGLDGDFSRLAENIVSGRKAAEPFPILAMPLSAALQKACSEIYVREQHPPSSLLLKFEGKFEHDRIRLGYFSADFYNHPIGYLTAGLFEAHDRAQFESIAFSFGPVKKDEMRMRLEKSFDRFFEVGGMQDKDVAQLARSLEIDIAIDLNGFTQGGRTDVFAMRAAPIQVNCLGYPGTMGAEYIDYLLADSILIPEEDRRHYAEKIAYLPDTYQVNDSKRLIADKRFTRIECALPEKAFVFCCFNNNYKITPEIFDLWMRLLNRVEGSVLWLLEDNVSATKNLRAEAQARSIAPGRLVFAKRLDLPEHLARHRLADLFLDTLPYNAHTTASDALWAGLPVMTCLGETFAGRVAASLLNAVGLPELITHNLDEYEAIALELATNPQRLSSLRQKLAVNCLTHPLFDTARFTKHIESAYVAMCERHQAGLAPEHLYVPAASGQRWKAR
jgi:protein O-GlcNAc transferase